MMKLDIPSLTVDVIQSAVGDFDHKHIVLCSSRQHGWATAELLANEIIVKHFTPTVVPLVTTIPDALLVLQALVQPPIVVLAPSPVFLYPGWACPLDCPTKFHATYPMHDEEIAQFMGRFNRFNAKTGNIGDNLSVGKVTRFSDIAC